MASSRQVGSVAREIGERVRARRTQDGLTIEAVARVLGIEGPALEAAERGDVNFTAEQIVELSTILRVMPSWFFDGLDTCCPETS